MYSWLLLLSFFLPLTLIFSTPSVKAQNPLLLGDIDSNGKVDIFDYNQLLTDFGKTGPNLISDLDKDGSVGIFDYNSLLTNFGKIGPIPSPSTPPSPSALVSTQEWVQFGHDGQRTNYTSQIVPTSWRYKWQWNGAGADGKKQAGHLSAPDLVQPITGGGRVYMIAANTVYALNKTNGSIIWQRGSIGTLLATPAYDSESLYVPSSNNTLYKLNAADGSTQGNFAATAGLNLAPLLVGNNIYVNSASGILYKLDKSNMSKVWEYSGGSPSSTPISYSPSKNILIYLTQDLQVHAVNNIDGTRKWRVKPTTRIYQAGTPNASGAQAEDGWPVIAEQHGIVFVRYRLDWDTLWTWNPYPITNAQIKANLTGNPNVQALFALNLDDGSKVFVPNVGNGGAGDGGTLPMGPQPVIKNINGQEVAYIIWRNGLTCASGWCDGREDATMGEMVLDGITVSGYNPGDVRFVRFIDIQTDEMMNLAMSGDTIFHSHWLINAAKKITDRSATRGGTFTNPIEAVDAPNVIWRQVYCPPTNTNCNPQIFPGGSGFSWGPSDCPFDALHRYCSAGLYSYGDQRGYPAGFYEYHNDNNSGTTPFTVVSDGMVLVKTNDGAIIALETGNPLADNRNLLQKMASLITDKYLRGESAVLGAQAPGVVPYQDAKKYLGQEVTVEGVIKSAVNNRPKAIYLGFTDPHDGALLLRIFEKDLSKFNFDPMTLKDRKIRVRGFVTLYWPEGKDPEIIVTDPLQISF